MKVRVSIGVVALAAFSSTACKGKSTPPPTHDLAAYCAVLGARLDERAVEHESQRSLFERLAARLNANPNGVDVDHRYFIAYTADAKATLRVGWMLGMRCVTTAAEAPCRAVYSTRQLYESGELEKMAVSRRNIRDAFRGQGPCVERGLPANLKELDPCDELRLRLNVGETHVNGLPAVERAWAAAESLAGRGPMPTRFDGFDDALSAATFALEDSAEHRALVDYGLAVLPFCAGPDVARSCESLRSGLPEAGPGDLRARAKALHRAVGGTPCEPKISRSTHP